MTDGTPSAEYIGGCGGTVSRSWMRQACDPNLKFRLDKYATDRSRHNADLAGVTTDSIETVFEMRTDRFTKPLCEIALGAAATKFEECGGTEVSDCSEVPSNLCLNGDYYVTIDESTRNYCQFDLVTGGMVCASGVSPNRICAGSPSPPPSPPSPPQLPAVCATVASMAPASDNKCHKHYHLTSVCDQVYTTWKYQKERYVAFCQLDSAGDCKADSDSVINLDLLGCPYE